MRRGIALGIGLGDAGFSLIGGTRGEGRGADLLTRMSRRSSRRTARTATDPARSPPFSLLTFEQARKRASDIAHVTAERTMPPWPASTSFGGPFLDQRVLSEADLATLRAWVDAGCPEGDAKDAPPAREFASDWPLGKPDVILTMAEPYDLERRGERRVPGLRAQDRLSRRPLDQGG